MSRCDGVGPTGEASTLVHYSRGSGRANQRPGPPSIRARLQRPDNTLYIFFGLIKACDPAGNAQGSRCWENSLCYRDALTRHLSYIYRATARDPGYSGYLDKRVELDA